MESADVLVFSMTRSEQRKAKLYLASGLLEFETGEWSHVTAERYNGRSIFKEKEKEPKSKKHKE